MWSSGAPGGPSSSQQWYDKPFVGPRMPSNTGICWTKSVEFCWPKNAIELQIMLMGGSAVLLLLGCRRELAEKGVAHLQREVEHVVASGRHECKQYHRTLPTGWSAF